MPCPRGSGRPRKLPTDHSFRCHSWTSRNYWVRRATLPKYELAILMSLSDHIPNTYHSSKTMAGRKTGNALKSAYYKYQACVGNYKWNLNGYSHIFDMPNLPYGHWRQGPLIDRLPNSNFGTKPKVKITFERKELAMLFQRLPPHFRPSRELHRAHGAPIFIHVRSI